MFGGQKGSQGRNTSSLRMEDFMTAADTVSDIEKLHGKYFLNIF